MWSAATCRSFGVVKTACGASRYGWRGERICGPNRFIGLADSSPPRSDWYLEVNRDVSNTAKLRELAALRVSRVVVSLVTNGEELMMT